MTNDDTYCVLQLIEDKRVKRNDIARVYRNAICYNAPVDFKAINAAIIDRWSLSALEYIKNRAWTKEMHQAWRNNESLWPFANAD